MTIEWRRCMPSSCGRLRCADRLAESQSNPTRNPSAPSISNIDDLGYSTSLPDLIGNNHLRGQQTKSAFESYLNCSGRACARSDRPLTPRGSLSRLPPEAEFTPPALALTHLSPVSSASTPLTLTRRMRRTADSDLYGNPEKVKVR